ncbi:MAG: hypothetical protein QF449_08395 [Alphaproteobacteria bacterium]|jgi:hypothetical protein|nr:hypothetical protein [Alphaproteobacteria bacterium]MDP6818046.1 hypothetical protein [Alphaproteobacteria bacterium]
MAQDLSEQVMHELLRTLSRDGAKNSAKMAHILNLLARYRAREIGAALYSSGGALVRSGPFRGMTMHNRASEGNVAPKLLGCYEQELHEVIERCIESAYECVVNIGCGDGYYAVGMARRMPNCEIKAYDLNKERRAFSRITADENGVGGRVTIGSECNAEELAALAGRHVLVVCDIEGGERELLDPERIPALKGFDILVELHEVLDKAMPEEILSRFTESHEIERIQHQGRDPNAFTELEKASHLDQWLALWEGRQGPTPWAFLSAK